MVFKRVDINKVNYHLHHLDTEESEIGTVNLNSRQSKFLKLYLNFQTKFLTKLSKDNYIKDGYLIIVPIKGAGYPNIYLLITKNTFYYVKEEMSILYRYRILKSRVYLEFSLHPSPAFQPVKLETYRQFFTDLLKIYENIMAYPSKFLISTKDGFSKSFVDDQISFGQIQKYL